MTVCVALVMALNFAVVFLLLTGTNLTSGQQSSWGRTAAAAGVGSAYSGICLIPGFGFLGNGFWRIVFLVLISCVAFGLCRSAVRKAAIFSLLSMALGGATVSLNEKGGIPLVLGAGGIFLLCCFIFLGADQKTTNVPVEITYGGQSSRFTAMHDTGNTLRDPTTGQRVLVIDCRIAENLFGFTKQQLCKPVETMLSSGRIGLRLIPYSTVGQPEGMLLGIRCDTVQIGKWKGSMTVAMAPNIIGKGENYQALTGGMY